MTLVALISQTRRRLVAAVFIIALASALVAAVVTAAGLAVVVLVVPITPAMRSVLGFAGILIAAGAAALMVWRNRTAFAIDHVALWIEECEPRLQYAVVTAIDARFARARASLDATAAALPVAAAVRRRLIRGTSPVAAAGTIAATILIFGFSAGGFRSIPTPRRTAGLVVDRLGDLRVRVTPPAYARAATHTLVDPLSVDALIGSQVQVEGRGASAGLVASLGDKAISVTSIATGWMVRLPMPRQPIGLQVRDSALRRERVLVMEPRADAPPTATLILPARDTTIAGVDGAMVVRAAVSDSIGLSRGRIEYLVSSGSGETFTAHLVTSALVDFANARAGQLVDSVPWRRLALKAGNVVSIRAVIDDDNTVTGPSRATSETRTVRLAKPAEPPTSVRAGPARVDTTVLSERMLILSVETLNRQRPALSRHDFVNRAVDIGQAQSLLKARVDQLLHPSDPTDGTGGDAAALSLEATTALETAYDAMADAERALGVAETDSALPSMRKALRALDRLRRGARLYLRGAPPHIAIDIERVRLTGRDTGQASHRTALAREGMERDRLVDRLDAATDTAQRSPPDGLRVLTSLRVDLEGEYPQAAASVAVAVDALRQGHDPGPALGAARRALAGTVRAVPAVGRWTGGW